MANLNTVPAHLLRDRDPEAKALGGWYVEFDLPEQVWFDGSSKAMRLAQKASTDYCRSPHAALLAGLALAFRLGVQIEVL